MKRKLILFAVFLMLFGKFHSQTPPVEPGISHDLAIWRAARYSDVRYKLNLSLEKMSPVLKGTIEIRVNVSPLPKGTSGSGGLNTSVPRAVAGGEVPPIVLDWRKIRGSDSLSSVSNVSLNGAPMKASPATARGTDPAGSSFQESNEHLIFTHGVKAGENVIKLDFTSPILTSGSAITRYVDKADGSEYIYSLFVPSDASTAFPVFDQPDLKAKFILGVAYPNDWRLISNAKRFLELPPGTYLREEPSGKVIKTTNGKDQSYTSFGETRPISTYVFAFAAGPWEEFSDAGRKSVPGAVATRAVSANVQKTPPATAGGTDLVTHFYVRKSQAEKFKAHSAEVFRLNREGMKYLEEYFDYKFPFPKYDIVLIPEFPFGGMEHAGATFLKESSIIFPSEPTANDHISRANVIFHEAAHQWFGDTVTMRWFDDLWLKEGFAEFMAYKTLERVMPQYNAWKAFYERNKLAAYLTDSTRGTTPIYQDIPNLSAAKSAYGNIVYRKAPSFLRQAEFYLGPDKFQTAVRAFLKKHEFGNAGWEDLVKEFEGASKQNLKEWANAWVRERGLQKVKGTFGQVGGSFRQYGVVLSNALNEAPTWVMKTKAVVFVRDRQTNITETEIREIELGRERVGPQLYTEIYGEHSWGTKSLMGYLANYQDYGYGIFLLDDKSRDYVLKNIQNEKDDFLRSMMWGALWDSIREGELDPREYVELAIKNLPTEKDETITAAVLGRVSTAMAYYVSVPPAVAGGAVDPSASSKSNDLNARLEYLLIDKMRSAPTLGQRITFYRAFLNIASTANARTVLRDMLKVTGGNLSGSEGAPQANGLKGTLPTGRVSASVPDIPLKTKDRFDIVTKLAILNDPEAPKLLADLERSESSDDAKRYAYAAKAGFPTKENREKFWSDFVNNKDISESWIELAMGPFNSPRHSELSLPYLQRALAELPELKRNRKIFFVNGWLGAFIGGQKSQAALDIVNKFLADNPDLDKDLRLKILENVDVIERAVKIRNKFNN